jgi:hypothetical protein
VIVNKLEYVLDNVCENIKGEYTKTEIINNHCPSDWFMPDGDMCTDKNRETNKCAKCWLADKT